jgi:hypothetical protein
MFMEHSSTVRTISPQRLLLGVEVRVVAVRRGPAAVQEALDQALEHNGTHAHLKQNQLDNTEQIRTMFENIFI